MKKPPPIDVINAFNASGDLKSLEGGEGRCWLAEGIVLKPCDNPAMWHWLAEHLPRVPTQGFRLPLPIPALSGQWVVKGWCAQQAVEGQHQDEGRWAEVLHVLDLFHQAIRPLPCPDFIKNRQITDPWILGDRVAWQEESLRKDYAALSHLLNLRTPIQAESQLIHGDFTGNVLFSQYQTPAVIDISPYWRPVGFAYGIVVADAVCWEKANAEILLEQVSHVEDFAQFLVRALIFRMVTTIAVAKNEPDLAGYAPGIDLAAKLVS
jgi:uncharacterized protein (TIGR02569 family)